MRGQAYPAINDTDFARLPFPLPPLAEQHRIVAKVDELMALCDRLEAAQKERETTRNRLAAASLARLNTPDPVVFQNHAVFALNNLTPLTTRPDQIKALRRTILNLAVRGKLVEQDSNDEPAGELLERIAAEKKRMVEAGEVRKPKKTSLIDYSSLLFGSPPGWVWARALGYQPENSLRIYSICEPTSCGCSITSGSQISSIIKSNGILFQAAKSMRKHF